MMSKHEIPAKVPRRSVEVCGPFAGKKKNLMLVKLESSISGICPVKEKPHFLYR